MATLLLGSEAGQATAHATTAERAEGFIFTAAETGLIEDIFLETNGTANTGVTKVLAAVYALEEQAVTFPGLCIQEAELAGAPAINTLLHFAGFSVPVVKGKKYALVLMSIGAALHFNVHGASGTAWRIGKNSAASLYKVNGFSGAWEAEKLEGPPKFYAQGKKVGTGRGLIFGLNGAKNHSASWVAKKVSMNRGSPTETSAKENGVFDKTPTEVSTNVGTMLSEGFTHPVVILNLENIVLLSKVNIAEFAKHAAEIVKKVQEDHPTAEIYYEIINEPWEKGPNKASNGKDYANIVKATIEEAKAKSLNVSKFLVFAYGTYGEVNAEGVTTGVFSDVSSGKGWMVDMATAQPSLKAGGANEIQGWTTHNYGRAYESSREVKGGAVVTAANRFYTQMAGFGGLNNWCVTEWGFNTIGGTTGRNVATEAEQNSCIIEYLECQILMFEAGWLDVTNYYDDGSDEKWNIFGLTGGTTFGTFANEHASGEPVLVKPATQTSEKGKTALLAMENTGGASTEWTASELPAGLGISPTAGVITGTPTTIQTKIVTIKAKNAFGTSEVTFEWKIIAGLAPPALTNPGEQVSIEGSEVVFAVTNTGGAVEAAGWSASELPTAISINSTSGVIKGFPTTPQTKSVTVKAKNAAGSAEVTFTWMILSASAVHFKVKAGKAGVRLLAVRNSDGNVLSLTLTNVYSTSDPNEIWLLRNVFGAYVEEF